MRHLSAITIIMFVIFLPSCKYFKGGLFGKKADTMAVWQARQDSIRVADSLMRVQDQLRAIENARLDSIRKADNERLAFDKKYKYNIIVGSFITPEYARDLSSEYRKNGYNSRIIKMDGSRFELVAAEAHDNFRNAVARLKEFQDTVTLDAWMYIKK